MNICGKGCMPECEYFTTGGCISPFSCPYKIETGYINSATSTTDSLTGILMEFDEMGLLRQRHALNPEQTAIEWKEQVVKEIQNLQAENAELRARLDRAVELPFFQKDGEVIVLIYKEKHGIVLVEEYIEDEYYNGKRGKEVAEARLKELQEKGK